MDRSLSLDELLDNIVQWTGRIESYIADMDFDAFKRNQMAQDAVIRCPKVIGEASAQTLKIAPDSRRNIPSLSFGGLIVREIVQLTVMVPSTWRRLAASNGRGCTENPQ